MSNLSSWPADDNVDGRPVFDDRVGGQDAAPVEVGIEDGVASEDAAGIEDGVAAKVAAIADESAELAQAGVERLSVEFDQDIGAVEFEVRDLDAGTEMNAMAENGVTHVVVVGSLGPVEEKSLFQLRGVANHAMIPDDNVFPDIGIVPDLAVPADDRRAFDHHAVFDDRAFPDRDLVPDPRHTVASVAQAGTDMLLDVVRQARQRFPGMRATLEQRCMFRLAQFEQVTSSKHGAQSSPDRSRAKVFCASSCDWRDIRARPIVGQGNRDGFRDCGGRMRC
jgi:hypothetical protein